MPKTKLFYRGGGGEALGGDVRGEQVRRAGIAPLRARPEVPAPTAMEASVKL